MSAANDRIAILWNINIDGEKILQDTNAVIEKKSKYLWVTAKGGLRVRESAGLRGKKVGLLEEGDKVKFLEEQGESKTISGTTGKWTKVEYREYKKYGSTKTTGWVFGGFLAAEKHFQEIAGVKVSEGCYQFNTNNFPQKLETGCLGDDWYCGVIKNLASTNKRRIAKQFDQGQMYLLFLPKGKAILVNNGARSVSDFKSIKWTKQGQEVLVNGKYSPSAVNRMPEDCYGGPPSCKRNWTRKITKKYGGVGVYFPFQLRIWLNRDSEFESEWKILDTSKYAKERKQLQPRHTPFSYSDCIHPL
ncbi:MAG: SH3 domain-containing protein [Spirochaetota bacterium]